MECVMGNTDFCEKKNTLIIEDDKAIRDSLKFVLEFEGYNVFTASNGKEGIEILSKIPQPCLILLDLMMPVMNGWDFIENLNTNQNHASIPVVVVSAFVEKARNIKARKVLKKPVDVYTLVNTVKTYCDENYAGKN